MTDRTVRVVYDTAVVMAGALCLRETTEHEPCIRPWGHDGDCDPDGLDGAQQRHPAGRRATCKCSHDKSQHSYGERHCFLGACGCTRFREKEPKQ